MQRPQSDTGPPVSITDKNGEAPEPARVQIPIVTPSSMATIKGERTYVWFLWSRSLLGMWQVVNKYQLNVCPARRGALLGAQLLRSRTVAEAAATLACEGARVSSSISPSACFLESRVQGEMQLQPQKGKQTGNECRKGPFVQSGGQDVCVGGTGHGHFREGAMMSWSLLEATSQTAGDRVQAVP